MATDRPSQHRLPPTRARVAVAAVALAYAAFAVFAQLIGEDEADGAELARVDSFCTALYADYVGLISTMASQGAAFGPLGDTEGGRQLSSGFINVDLAPEQFRDQVAYLAEGLDRAANGELTPADVGPYARAHEELREAATPTCNAVGREVDAEDLDQLEDAG